MLSFLNWHFRICGAVFVLCMIGLMIGQSRVRNFDPRNRAKELKSGRQSCSILEEERAGSCELLTVLAVEGVTATAGEIVDVRVLGAINGEETFGVTIMVEILSRPDNVGDVWFTGSPPSDILQIGDPWLDIGVFSSYDTDLAGSDFLNGSVDDDGDYLAVPVVYSGPLSMFPVQVGEGASGVWDISLSTVAGDSDWEGVDTVLRHGTITIKD